MLRNGLVGLTVLLIGFSGCIGGDDDTGETTPAPTNDHEPEPAMVIPWSVLNCQFVMAVVPVAVDAVAGLLPPGFTAVKPEEMALPDDPRGDAMLGLEGEACPEGEGLNGTIKPVSITSFWVPVKPPETLKTSPYSNTTADMYIVKPRFSFPDAERRQMLSHEGVDVQEGEATFNMPAPGLGPFTAKVEMGTETVDYYGAGATNQAVVDKGHFQDFTCHAFTAMYMDHGGPQKELEGYARWETRFVANGPGQTIKEFGGEVTVSAGGFAASILGEGAHPAYMLVGIGSYTDGKLYVPHMPHSDAPRGSDSATH